MITTVTLRRTLARNHKNQPKFHLPQAEIQSQMSDTLTIGELVPCRCPPPVAGNWRHHPNSGCTKHHHGLYNKQPTSTIKEPWAMGIQLTTNGDAGLLEIRLLPCNGIWTKHQAQMINLASVNSDSRMVYYAAVWTVHRSSHFTSDMF